MRILSMGIESIDPEKFKRNGTIELNKPRFGLYGSTLVTNSFYNQNGPFSSWLEFVHGSDFHSERYEKGISYTLHKKAKIYTVHDEKSYLKLLKKYSTKRHFYENEYELMVDWNRFARDYDAFHLTLDAFWDLRMYYNHIKNDDGTEYSIRDFYSYDCETWIIFNLDCINLGSVFNVSIKCKEDYRD